MPESEIPKQVWCPSFKNTAGAQSPDLCFSSLWTHSTLWNDFSVPLVLFRVNLEMTPSEQSKLVNTLTGVDNLFKQNRNEFLSSTWHPPAWFYDSLCFKRKEKQVVWHRNCTKMLVSLHWQETKRKKGENPKNVEVGSQVYHMFLGIWSWQWISQMAVRVS